MSLKFRTDDVLDTLFDIAIGNYDYEIRKRTKGKVKGFSDLHQPGAIVIYFDKDKPKQPRDEKGRFTKSEEELCKK